MRPSDARVVRRRRRISKDKAVVISGVQDETDRAIADIWAALKHPAGKGPANSRSRTDGPSTSSSISPRLTAARQVWFAAEPTATNRPRVRADPRLMTNGTRRIVSRDEIFRWNAEKNLQLVAERAIFFEEIVAAMANGGLRRTGASQRLYPNQRLFVVRVRTLRLSRAVRGMGPRSVPEDESCRRKATRKYLRRDVEHRQGKSAGRRYHPRPSTPRNGAPFRARRIRSAVMPALCGYRAVQGQARQHSHLFARSGRHSGQGRCRGPAVPDTDGERAAQI